MGKVEVSLEREAVEDKIILKQGGNYIIVTVSEVHDLIRDIEEELDKFWWG